MHYFIHPNLFKKICKNLHKEIKNHNSDVRLTYIHHEISRALGYYNYRSYLKLINKYRSSNIQFDISVPFYSILLCATKNILSHTNISYMELILITNRTLKFTQSNTRKKKMKKNSIYNSVNSNIELLRKRISLNQQEIKNKLWEIREEQKSLELVNQFRNSLYQEKIK